MHKIDAKPQRREFQKEMLSFEIYELVIGDSKSKNKLTHSNVEAEEILNYQLIKQFQFSKWRYLHNYKIYFKT